VSRNDQEEPAPGVQQLAESPHRRLVIRDVLQNVEADDGIDRLAKRDVLRLALKHLDVRHGREPLFEEICELRVGLRRDDPVAPGRRQGRERPDSRPDVEYRATQIGATALEQPRVVVVGDLHPAQGLVLPR